MTGSVRERRQSINRPLAALAAAVLLVLPGPLAAFERANIMVVAEDFDLGTLPRDTRVSKGVLETLSGALDGAGYGVYDETRLTLDGFTQGRTQRPEAEIIDIARAVTRPPLDLVVLYSLYAHAETFSYSQKISSRLTARVLDLRAGRRLGSFDLAPAQQLRLPLHCQRDCILARLEDSSRQLARQLSATLVRHLQAKGFQARRPAQADATGLPAPIAGYRLVFVDFSTEEVADIEEYLVVFKGYRLHRPIRTVPGRHEYWYESTSPRARLNRNLIKMLDHVRIGGDVGFEDDSFTVTKLADPEGDGAPWDAW